MTSTLQKVRETGIALDRLHKSYLAIGDRFKMFDDAIRPETEFEWDGEILTAEKWSIKLNLSFSGFKTRVRDWGICEKTFTPSNVKIKVTEIKRLVKSLYRKMLTREIAEEANRLGIKNQYGRPYDASSISKLIKRMGLK